jgi:imidazolonepropionase-like amidohydrolase
MQTIRGLHRSRLVVGLVLLGVALVLVPAILIFDAVAQTTAFVNVNIVPMNQERILPNHTVIVEGDRIAAVGPIADITIPANAEVIDGQGAYLMPGLADMHAHLELRDRDPGSLLLFLAEGTTTVRSPSGLQLNRAWRDAVERGELVGPTILTAGKVLFGLAADDSGLNIYVQGFRIATLVLPLAIGVLGLLVWIAISRATGRKTTGIFRRRRVLAGGIILLLVGGVLYVTKTPPGQSIIPYVTELPAFISEKPEHVIAEVRRQQEAGVDFIKPYDGLTIPEYLAAIAEGKRLGMYVLSHALDEASLETIVTSGIDEIAHLDELNFFHWRGEFGAGDFFLDYEAIPATVALLKGNNVNIVSNMSLDEALVNMIFEPKETLARPEYSVVRPEMIEFWRTEGRQNGRFAQQGTYRRDMEMDFFLALAKALNDAGVIVTTGTDTAPWTEGSLPSHIHRELELLVEAGLSNFDALSAGTRNSGLIFDRMGADGSFGTVEIGQRADLILLTANPLENVSATRERNGVMVRGDWYTQVELDALVAEFVATY